MKENRVQMFVHPRFKHRAKVYAATEGKSMIEYTKDLSEMLSNLKRDFKYEKRIKFDFP